MLIMEGQVGGVDLLRVLVPGPGGQVGPDLLEVCRLDGSIVTLGRGRAES